MWNTILLVAALFSPPAIVLEGAPGSVEREAMKKLEFFVGEWRGEGLFRGGPGPGEKASVVEKAEMKLGGLVLLLEGLGTAKGADGSEKVVHNAFGMLTYDAKRGMYTMRAVKSDGAAIDAEAKFEGDAFVWGFDVPGGSVRYTIRLTPEGKWHEVGQFSRDGGKTFTPFFEMTLVKVKPSAG